MKRAGPIPDEAFERLLGRIDEESFHGYLFQYPPIMAWPPLKRQAGLLGAWRRAAGRAPSQIYVNFPYCKTRCTFCFLPVAVSDLPADFDAYLDALEAERRLWRGAVSGRRFSTLYMGGGTPSLLSSAQLERLFSGLYEDFRFEKGAQVALEANPAFADGEKMRVLKGLGVEWLSLGVQSLNPAVIARVERWQDNRSVFRAFAAAKEAGIRYVNIDLLCGVEGQTEQSFLFDVKSVARLRPDQVHLNFFEDTRMTLFSQRGGSLKPADVARARAMHAKGREILLAAGYSNVDGESFSLEPGAQNRQASAETIDAGHPTLGLGAGAVSYLPLGYRHINYSNPEKYRSEALGGRLPVFRSVKLDRDTEMTNFALNRLLFGANDAGELALRDLSRRFKAPPTGRLARELSRLVKEGFLRRKAGRYVPDPGNGESAFRIKQGLMSTPLMRRAAAARRR